MSRVIAQILIGAATVLVRAGTQAWAQALVNAQKSGVANEAVSKAASRVAGGITADEARLILQVEPHASWGEVVKRFNHLFEVNKTHGSFYLQSKVYRAKERLEQDYEVEGRKDEPQDPSQQKQIRQ